MTHSFPLLFFGLGVGKEFLRSKLCRRADMGEHRCVKGPIIWVCVYLWCNCTVLLGGKEKQELRVEGHIWTDYEQPWVQREEFGVSPEDSEDHRRILGKEGTDPEIEEWLERLIRGGWTGEGSVGLQLRKQEGGGCDHTGQMCPGVGCGLDSVDGRTAGVRAILEAELYILGGWLRGVRDKEVEWPSLPALADLRHQWCPQRHGEPRARGDRGAWGVWYNTLLLPQESTTLPLVPGMWVFLLTKSPLTDMLVSVRSRTPLSITLGWISWVISACWELPLMLCVALHFKLQRLFRIKIRMVLIIAPVSGQGYIQEQERK